MKPKVSIIILNWNGLKDTIECLESLKKITYPNYKVIIVDNGSDNEEGKIIKERYGDYIYLIQNNENLGFAEGNNKGIRYVLTKDTNYILLLNNDVIVNSRFLEEMIKVAESQPEIGVTGAKIYYHGSNRIFAAGGGYLNLWLDDYRLIGNKQFDKGQFDNVKPGYISGCCFLIKDVVLKKDRFLDKDYFLYNEEVDFCLKIKKMGYKLAWSLEALIWHKVARGSKYLSKDYIYYMLRNKLLLMKKNAQWYHWITFLPIFIFRDCLGYALVSVFNKNIGGLVIIFKAIRDFLKNRVGRVI